MKYTIVSYKGFDLGAIYLNDVQQRSQLGAGRQFVVGQDQYIRFSDEIALVNTGEVLMSLEKGILKLFTTENDPHVAEMAEAAGETVFYDAEGNPTGLAAPISTFELDDLAGATGLFRSATVGTKEDPAESVGEF